MFKLTGISTFKSKKNGKDYVVLHLTSVAPIANGSGYSVETCIIDIQTVDVPALNLGDKVNIFYNKSGFVQAIIKA